MDQVLNVPWLRQQHNEDATAAPWIALLMAQAQDVWDAIASPLYRPTLSLPPG